jgi:hypothetical protein
MSTTRPQGLTYQLHVDDANFMDQSVLYMLAASLFIAIFAGTTNRCLTSEWDPDIFGFTFFVSIVWSFPVMFYFLYHRATLPLPEWLTSGRPVTFGGIAPNVCEAGASGIWPCFPKDFKNLVGNVVGLKGWEYLVPRQGTIWLLFFFLALNFVIVVLVRRYRQIQQSLDTSKDNECKDQEADATLVELGYVEK